MRRRDFLRSLVGGVAVAAAVRTWPFRIFSFPTQPVLTPDVARRILTTISDACQFEVGDMVWILNPAQKKAWDKLSYKIRKIDQQERAITIENVLDRPLTYKNISCSPKSFRVGVT